MTCSIEADGRAAVVNGFLQARRSANWIEGEMRRLGRPTKSETVQRHLRLCLNNNVANITVLQSGLTGREVDPNTDFAQAIRAEANRLLAEGKLHVTAQHGLQAQALLDRRVEKAADRKLLVQVAGLLSGTVSLAGPPDDLIEGEWSEVQPALALSGGDTD
jgi:membrane peptidoglycan carboxypeptidase